MVSVEDFLAAGRRQEQKKTVRQRKLDEFMGWAHEVFGKQLPFFIPCAVDCKKGTRTPTVKWTKPDLEETHYWLQCMIDALAEENQDGCIMVRLGAQSDNLCVLDVDADELVGPLLEANPVLNKTLQTRGSKGRHFWVYMEGDYPQKKKQIVCRGTLKPIEFLTEGGLCTIWGTHYKTGEPYQRINDAPPITLKFEDLKLPVGGEWKGRPSSNGAGLKHSRPHAHGTISRNGGINWAAYDAAIDAQEDDLVELLATEYFDVVEVDGVWRCGDITGRPATNRGSFIIEPNGRCTEWDDESHPTLMQAITSDLRDERNTYDDVFTFLAQQGEEFNFFMPAALDVTQVKDLPELILPCDSYTIEQSGKVAYTHFKENKLFFRQGPLLKRVHPDATDGEWLETIKPETLRGILGKYFNCKSIIQGSRGDYTTLKLCSADKARSLLASDTLQILNPIQAVLACPIFVEDDQGNLKVLGKGYHPENGGTYVVTNEVINENIGLEESRKALLSLIDEFLFVTSADKSRCLADLLAPAFRFGRLVKADFPLQIFEASVEQTGKTFLTRLIATLYHERPFPVTGADKLDEKLSTAILSGSGMILLDNVRGLISSELFESSVRGEGTVSARKAYAPVVKAPTNHIIWQATSNKAASTPDLAARSLICRLNKHPDDYVWKTYPEGDLLLHIAKRRGYFLSCIFTILREWHKAGKPKTTPVDHDFRELCGVMDWCVTKLLGQTELLMGHRDEQMRLASPELNWMRSVAIEVARINRLLEQLRTREIVKICDDAGLAIPGMDHWNKSPDRDSRIPAEVGKLMKRIFKQSRDGCSLTVGAYKVEKEEIKEYNPVRKEFMSHPVYIFAII